MTEQEWFRFNSSFALVLSNICPSLPTPIAVLLFVCVLKYFHEHFCIVIKIWNMVTTKQKQLNNSSTINSFHFFVGMLLYRWRKLTLLPFICFCILLNIESNLEFLKSRRFSSHIGRQTWSLEHLYYVHYIKNLTMELE